MAATGATMPIASMSPNPFAGASAPGKTAMAIPKRTTSTALAEHRPVQPYLSVQPPAMSGAVDAMTPMQLLRLAGTAPAAPRKKGHPVSSAPAAKAAMKLAVAHAPRHRLTTCPAPVAVPRELSAQAIVSPACPKVLRTAPKPLQQQALHHPPAIKG